MSFFLFLLYIFLTFFRPIELFAPELGEMRPMLWLWLLAIVVSVGTALSTKNIGARTLHFKFIFGFWLVIAISKLLSPWASGTLDAVIDFSTSSMLFVLAALNLNSIERVKATMVTVALAMLCNAGFGINAYHTGLYMDLLIQRQATGLGASDDPGKEAPPEQVLVPALDNSGWFMWRVKSLGFLSDPNDFAQALVMTLPMVWGAYRAGKHFWNLVMVLAPGATLVYAIFLTQSRGALLGMASLVFFGIRQALGTTKTMLLLGAMGALQMVGNMAGGREFSGKERSAEERIESWQIGFQLLKRNPITGAGYGNYLEFNYLTAHNSFVLCFAELGLLGYFVWIGMIVMTFKSLSRTIEVMPEGSSEKHIATLLRSSVVGYMTCAWFLSRTYGPGLYFLLAICIATWASAVRSWPADRVPPQLVQIDWRKHTLVVMALTIAAVQGFILSHALSG